MINTEIFRLLPTTPHKIKLDENFTIYNRGKRIGYNELYNKARKDGKKIIFEGERETQQKLMRFCGNNSYVNTILIEIKTKLKQQDTWLEKKKHYFKEKINEIRDKIEKIQNKKDRRLIGLYSRLYSLQQKLHNLESSLQQDQLNQRLKPVVFGCKPLFRERILQKTTRKNFKIRRDASFGCIGKRQNGLKNVNIKVLPNKELKVRTFSKLKGKKWLTIPIRVNIEQEKRFEEILNVDKYTAIVKRKFVKDELRYYIHISYEIPDNEIQYSFDNGAIGLDFNYGFASLTNVYKNGDLESYHTITFRNLNSYRSEKRENYMSFKLDKIINYCKNKKKGIIIEDLSFIQYFSYNKKANRKINNFNSSALELLKRKCIKHGVAFREVPPHYTTQIGKYKYSRLHNLSGHILASYVIARRGLGFEEELPPIYTWLLSQVGDVIKPRLKKTSPNYKWSKIHDLFKHSGITSFKTPDIIEKVIVMKNVLNLATGAQSDNLRAGFSKDGKIDNYHKFWNFVNNFKTL